MLLTVIIVSLLNTIVMCVESNLKEVNVNEVKTVKQYMFPIPFELPNRNDRADQCWLRIEDVELVETLTVYCYLAHAFLSSHIHDYNSRKMTEDGVDVSLWIEKPWRKDGNITPPDNSPHSIKDWRVVTVMDPTTHRRLYVTKNADCRLIMYSREGMSNIHVECDKILYYVNVHMNGSGVLSNRENFRLVFINIFLIYICSYLL